MTTKNVVRDACSGNTIVLPVTVVDKNNALISLAGATITFVLRERSAKGTTVLTLTNATTAITVTGVGAMTITITAAQSEAFEGKYWMACNVIDTTPVEHTIALGTLNIEKVSI